MLNRKTVTCSSLGEPVVFYGGVFCPVPCGRSHEGADVIRVVNILVPMSSLSELGLGILFLLLQ